jgi:hypothetical protein
MDALGKSGSLRLPPRAIILQYWPDTRRVANARPEVVCHDH